MLILKNIKSIKLEINIKKNKIKFNNSIKIYYNKINKQNLKKIKKKIIIFKILIAKNYLNLFKIEKLI